jgi:hypothetical protein
VTPTSGTNSRRATSGSSRLSAAVPMTEQTRSGSLRRWGRHLGAAIVIAIAASVTPLLPWTTRANNTAALRESQTRLQVVERNNAQLESQKTALLSDAEVRRLAREEFGLAPTGAEVYSLPGLRPESPTRLASDSTTPTRSSNVTPPPPRRRIDRIIDVLVFWD